MKKLHADLSNLDEVSAGAPESVKWNDIWNKIYPKNMYQTPPTTPQPKGVTSPPGSYGQLKSNIEQQALQVFKATPHPHQYKMVIRHCRPDRTL